MIRGVSINQFVHYYRKPYLQQVSPQLSECSTFQSIQTLPWFPVGSKKMSILFQPQPPRLTNSRNHQHHLHAGAPPPGSPATNCYTNARSACRKVSRLSSTGKLVSSKYESYLATFHRKCWTHRCHFPHNLICEERTINL